MQKIKCSDLTTTLPSYYFVGDYVSTSFHEAFRYVPHGVVVVVVVVDEEEVEVEVEVHWVAERKINPIVSPTIQLVSGQCWQKIGYYENENSSFMSMC